MKKSAQDIIKKYEYLYGQTGNWRSYWQDVADFVLPRKAWITTIKIKGQQLNYNFLYDSRAILALKESAAGFHSNLTNPASKWFSMATLDDKHMQSGIVQRYFKEVEDIQYAIMNQSNFNNTMIESYTDLLCFGTSSILSQEDARRKIRYTSIPIEQTLIEEDADGEVCAFYRPFKLSAGSCLMKWKEKCSEDIKKAVKEGHDYQMFEIIHCTSRRDYRDVTKMDSVNMEWSSQWIEKEAGNLLEESGFNEFPFHVGRFWKHSDDAYGYSPAMDALASIKLANAQKRAVIRTSMKQSDPATMSPARFWLAPLNLNPSAMNYYDASKFKPDQFAAIRNEGNIPTTVQVMEMEQDLIDRAFFVTLFRSLSNVTKQMTVPEVQRRIAENLALVGPTIGRVVDGQLTPLLMRTYGILDRQLLFPPAPKEIQGKEMDIMYLSPLARSQRSGEMNGIATWLQLIGELSNFLPDVRYKVNAGKVADISADLLGVDPFVVVDQDKADAAAAKAAEMQMKMNQVEMVEKGARAAKSGAEAGKAHAEAGAIK